ncbi:hypothetical protein BU26DRAFT_561521 [Trematosphaeria pertusa]|uniref:Uncharacterized protein n=1 Tax=Trematosphaeria pertusa TaxID=390896 RepID=A0A6A6IQC6_9PLEO|nr:uncharacterized protein BU26DRAFT_561521 [Trematosphaeria pertusa]KAF2251713.1 hypothetical protein BU26DRAFT_561521 [Trematosphaeria pertusa]
MLELNLKPVIVALNNGDCTIERLAHGKAAFYGDVAILDNLSSPGIMARFRRAVI